MPDTATLIFFALTAPLWILGGIAVTAFVVLVVAGGWYALYSALTDSCHIVRSHKR